MNENSSIPCVLAGIAEKNPSLFRRIQVGLGDPAAWIESLEQRVALVRDLEMDRVRQNSRADLVTCPAEYTPEQGLDADRETATAQAVAEFCRQQGWSSVRVDRTLPFVFAWHLEQAGVGPHKARHVGRSSTGFLPATGSLATHPSDHSGACCCGASSDNRDRLGCPGPEVFRSRSAANCTAGQACIA